MADTIELSSAGTNEATLQSRRGVPFSLTLGPAAISGGVVIGGELTAHHIRVPWNYISDVDPIDVSMGTAFVVDGTVTVTDTGGLGPVVQTGFYGPRGIVNLETNWRYNVNMTSVGFAPIGHGDFITIGNQAGVTKTLAPSWSYLNGRSVVADGANCQLTITDVNQGGAAFADATVYLTTDGGTLDGLTQNHEVTSFYGAAGFCGNTSVRRRIVFDAAASYLGIHPLIPNPTGAHWSGFGTFDATSGASVQLDEEIGLRVHPFTLGDIKIGVQSAHVIQSLYSPLTNTSTTTPIMGLTVGADSAGAAVTHTLNDTGGGFSAGNNFRGLFITPTVVYDAVGGLLGSFSAVSSAPTLKNVNGEARTIPLSQPLALRTTYRGDGALLTVTSHVGYDDLVVADIVSGGTVSITDAVTVSSTATIGTGATVVTRKGLSFSDGTGAGAITNQIAVDIPVLAKGGTLNIGLRNASTEVATPSVATITVVGSTIIPNAKIKRLDNTSGGSLTLTSAPTIPDGQDGQILVLFNSSANNVVVQDQGTLANSNLRLSATTVTIGQRDSLMLVYSSTIGDWIEIGNTNVL